MVWPLFHKACIPNEVENNNSLKRFHLKHMPRLSFHDFIVVCIQKWLLEYSLDLVLVYATTSSLLCHVTAPLGNNILKERILDHSLNNSNNAKYFFHFNSINCPKKSCYISTQQMFLKLRNITFNTKIASITNLSYFHIQLCSHSNPTAKETTRMSFLDLVQIVTLFVNVRWMDWWLCRLASWLVESLLRSSESP